MESSLRSRSYKLCNSLIYFCIFGFSGQYHRTCFRVFLIFSLWPCFKTNVFILNLKLSLFSVSLFLRIPGWNYISWNSVLQIVDCVDISRNLNFRIRDKCARISFHKHVFCEYSFSQRFPVLTYNVICFVYVIYISQFAEGIYSTPSFQIIPPSFVPPVHST